MLRWVFVLIVPILASAAAGCALLQRHSNSDDTEAVARVPANTEVAHAQSETLGSFFYDGNAFAGDVKGPNSKTCEIAVEKQYSADRTEILTFEVSGKAVVDLFARKYANSISLSESGKSLVFVGDGESLMNHPGKEHSFTLETDKAEDGDFLIKLVLKFDPIMASGYRFREFHVSAGHATRMVVCNDLKVVR